MIAARVAGAILHYSEVEQHSLVTDTMAKVVATIKAVVTRLVFAAHGLLAIWQVTIFKRDSHYWYLSAPVLLLFFEGIFTLTIKRSQEWKW